MPNVPVEKMHEPDETKSPLLRHINGVFREVEQRAFDLFKTRECQLGHALDDWLEAERQLLATPRAELSEREDKLEVKIAMPGFDVKEIEVTALPQEIIVHAAHKSEHTGDEQGVRWSEFEDKAVCRRVPLPSPIDVDSARSELNLGVLKITADKAPSVQSKRVTVAAAA